MDPPGAFATLPARPKAPGWPTEIPAGKDNLR
jgi:hypothetical protein